MYCLEKLQRELAYFLDIDLRDLPKVQEILKAQGYTAVKKNDEIIQLGGGKVSKEQVEKLKEVVEKPTPKVDNAEVLQINADEAITKLHSTQGQPIPQEIDIQTFKNVLESIENQDNFITHLQKKQDAQSRLAYLNLVEPTLKEWDIKLTKGDRKELIKVFNDGDNFFTLLITEQDNKRLITFIPKARDGYIESKIKNADLIQTFTSRASESKAEWTRVANSTTNNLKWQQDGNVLRSVVELDNGEKLLLSKDRLENVYIQSNHIEQVNSYDELILQESLEKFAKDEIENKLAKQIESISQFGENYPQFYHKAHEAIQHLLHTKSGQVQGAFYRDEIGDITLAWGEKGTGKSDGWGLAKIVEYHPEVLDKLDELVQNLPIVKENANRYQLENDMYKLSIRKDFEGQKENWILTAFEKDESIARRRTDLPSSQSEAEKTTSANATDIIPQKSSKATSQISKEIKDIIDSSPQKGRDMQIIGEANFTPQVVEYAHKNNKKVAIDKLSQAEAEQLGYKYPNDVRVTIDYSAINHTLNRHGAESALVKNSGQKAVDYTDIAEYRNIVKGADESLDSVDDLGQDVVLNFKQINGYAVVVESIRKKGNELAFKTMYFENGSYKNSNAYKNAVDSQKANPSPAPYGYEPHADANTPPKVDSDIIPQKSSKATSQISKEIKDIIDSSPQKGRDMQIIGEANFTPQVVEYAHKNNKKVAIDKLSQAEAEQLGYKYPNDVRVTIDYSAINHTLNRHGAESALVKNSGQKAVDYTDIAEYRNIVKGADESLDSVDNMGTPVVVSYKQINGHFVVVEEIRKGQNELNFKTMFKQEGNYKDSESYKKTSQSSNATEGYEPTANSFALTKKGYKPDLPTPNNIIPQNLLKAQSEYFNSLTNEYEKIKEIKKLHTQDDNLIRVMKVDGRNDYIEPLSNMSVSKEYLQKQTAQSLKENITQAILGNQTQLKVLQQGYNIYHLSSFQKEILESALDIANNPTKLKEYKLQGLQKQLNNLNSNEAYHIEKGRKYDKARYAKDRQELEKEITALKGTESSLESAPQKVDSSDIIFTDKKGKEHTLTKEVQEQWLNTFNLKSLDEAYTPKHSDEILQALGGKEIKLQLGSLKKLVAQGREQYIPQIKEVLDSPEAIMRDDMGEYLFIKHLKDDDYFVNVSFDNGEYLVSISNGIKETRNLNNKLEKGGSFIYQSPNFNSISQKLLQTSQYSANKIDNDIIPQMPKDNPQLVALQTKIQQSRQQIAESRNPDKEYLYQVFKPDEIIELEKQYFNQAMPQEYKELIQDFPRLYEQSLANELKTYAKDTDTIQEVTTQLLNDFKDKPFKNTAKHAELLLFNTLRDKAQELGFKELDINKPSFKVAFGKFQAKLKKGDIQDLSEHIATISLRKNRLRIEQSLNIKPLAEFGENYAEHYHSGESAIAKLLNEKQGQVAGAFYRKELGDIDLVWGDSNFGLKHILDKHGSEFKDIAKELDEIIQNGEVVKRKGRDEAYNIEYKGFKVGINKGFNKQGENKWVVTAFNDNIEKTAKTAPANDSTKGASLPLNSSTIIPQKSTKLQSNAHLGSG